MESCGSFIGVLQAYSEAEMAPELARRVSSHLDACHACRRRVTIYQELFGALEWIPQIAPPSEFRASVMSRVLADPLPLPASPSRAHLRLVHAILWTFFASGIAAGGAGATFLSRSTWGGWGLLDPGALAQALLSLSRGAFFLLLDVATRGEMPALLPSPHNPFDWGIVPAALAAILGAAAAVGLGILATARTVLREPRRR